MSLAIDNPDAQLSGNQISKIVVTKVGEDQWSKQIEWFFESHTFSSAHSRLD